MNYLFLFLLIAAALFLSGTALALLIQLFSFHIPFTRQLDEAGALKPGAARRLVSMKALSAAVICLIAFGVTGYLAFRTAPWGILFAVLFSLLGLLAHRKMFGVTKQNVEHYLAPAAAVLEKDALNKFLRERYRMTL